MHAPPIRCRYATTPTTPLPFLTQPSHRHVFSFPQRIVHLTAHNTGRQGGYGRRDTIRVLFNIRTDLAGLPLMTTLDRRTVDAIFVFSHSLGDSMFAYDGHWKDLCTFVIRAGNTTGATAPPTGRFYVSASYASMQQTRPDQTRPDQTRPDQTRKDQTRPDQTRTDQTRTYQNRPDQTRTDQARPARPDHARPPHPAPPHPAPFHFTPRHTTPSMRIQVRIRDDIHEIRDASLLLRVGSTSHSPVLEGTFGAAQGLAGRSDPLRATIPELALRRFAPHPSVTGNQLRIGPLGWHPISPFDAEWAESDRSSECDVGTVVRVGVEPLGTESSV